MGRTWAHSIATHTPETAQLLLDRFVADYPENALIYQSRGLFACKRGNFDLAIKDFSAAIELRGPTINSLYYRAAAYCNKQQWEDATADLSQAIQLEPSNPRLFQMRRRLGRTGKPEAGDRRSHKAVRLQPEPQLQEQLDSLLAQQASAEPKPPRQTGQVKQPGSQGRGRPLTRWRARRATRMYRWR